jgi:hypothetical protein
MKTPGYFILFCTIFYSWLIAQNFSTDFRLTISSDKSLYIEGESIWIKVEATNLSAESKDIFNLTHDRILSGEFLDFTIKNSKGEIIAYGREGADDCPRIILKANDTIYNYFDLLNYYGNPITEPYLGRKYLPEDTYQCVATFKLDRRTTTVESDTIRFVVRRVAGSEKVVFENFIRAYKTWLLDFNDNNAIRIYQEILVQYPQSLFALLSAYYITKITLISDQLTRDGIDTSLDFMDKYSDSPFAYKVAKLLLNDAYQNNRLETLEVRINTHLPKMEQYFPGITQLINNKIHQYQSE